MIHIENRVWNLLKDAHSANTIKIFFYIAINQPDEGIRGYRTTKIQLAVDLNLKPAMIFRSLKFLKDNLLIQELKLVEDFDFMANPYLAMNNGDRNERIAEWARRQHMDAEREQRLRQQRRRREARKAKNQ